MCKLKIFDDEELVYKYGNLNKIKVVYHNMDDVNLDEYSWNEIKLDIKKDDTLIIKF